MATIANQIKRISDSRDLLRLKGKELGLTVPAGNYWDDSTDSYKQYSQAALTDNDQIDKIAAAFNSIVPELGTEIKVPITVTTDGTTTTVDSYVLDTGFYANATIVPFIKVENVDDIVINVEMVADRQLTAQSAVIKPSSGFNYIGQFGYTIVDGAISSDNAGFDNTGVIAKVSKSGWLDANDTQKVAVVTSEMSSKAGSTTKALAHGGTVVPDAMNDTVLTITKGIFGSDRTLTVKSVASQTSGTAVKEDILSGKTAWVNGALVTGNMPNYGGTTTEEKYTAAASFSNHGGVLAVQPALGYYNDYSSITTDIVYNPTRVFNTTSVSGATEEVMAAKVYYETIPAGYYATAIKRKISVQDAVGEVKIDYSTHKATFKVNTPGWIASDVTVDISAGAALYKQSASDLESSSHQFVITPAMDQDGAKTSYLTQVTIDNTEIFDLLSAI